MTSHVIGGLTDGVEYTVRVIATTDDAESAPSGEVTTTPRETTPPAPFVGLGGRLNSDAHLRRAPGHRRDAGQDRLRGDRGRQRPGCGRRGGVGQRGHHHPRAGGGRGRHGHGGYTAPTDDVTARLQDLVGNVAASFSGQSVTNDTQAAAQFTASAHDVPAAHDGGTAFTFELRFSEEPKEDFSYKTLRDSAFTVTRAVGAAARERPRHGHHRAARYTGPCTGDGRKLSPGLLRSQRRRSRGSSFRWTTGGDVEGNARGGRPDVVGLRRR